MEKLKITNSNQFEKLVEELEKNPSLARGFRRGTVPNNFKEQWESVATALNSLGPPIRTTDGWQKIWRDLKFKVKKKLVTNKVECKATGGGIFKQLVLSPLEESVANLLQFQKQLNPEGMVQGVPNAECELLQIKDNDNLNSCSFEMEEVAACSSKAVSSPTTTVEPLIITTAPSRTTTTSSQNPLKRKSTSVSKAKNHTKRAELLQKHSDDQARLLTDISNSMLSIKRNLRDIKDIEEKRLKLEIRRNKREEEMHQADYKLKKIKLIIKENELELLNNKSLD